MNKRQESETQEILTLQNQIADRLDQLGFTGEVETRGNLIHHLAEAAVIGKKIKEGFLPAFLTLSANEKDVLQELIVEMNDELMELKDALSDLEPALIELMNFITAGGTDLK